MSTISIEGFLRFLTPSLSLRTAAICTPRRALEELRRLLGAGFLYILFQRFGFGVMGMIQQDVHNDFLAVPGVIPSKSFAR